MNISSTYSNKSNQYTFYISEPLLTFSLYSQFIEAGKCENYSVRLGKVNNKYIASSYVNISCSPGPPTDPAAALPPPLDAGDVVVPPGQGEKVPAEI